MTRRNFLNRSALTAVSLPSLSLLSGCGGTTENNNTPVNALVADLTAASSSSDGTHAALESETGLLLSRDAAQNSPAYAPAASSASTADFFAATLPTPSATSPVAALYLDKGGDKTMWERYRAYQKLAKVQFSHQYTKLLAAMRTADYRLQQNAPAVTAAASYTKRKTAEENLDEDDQEKIDDIYRLIEALADAALEKIPFDTIADVLDALREWVASLLESDTLKAVSFAVLTYFAVEKLLKLLQERLLENLDFTTRPEVMLSLAKMSIAAIAYLGVVSVDSLAPYAEEAEADEEGLLAFLKSISAQSQVALLVMQLSALLLIDTFSMSQEKIIELGDSPQNGEESAPYELTEGDRALAETLKERSLLLATVGLAMKALFALFSSEATGNLDNERGFAPESDADIFTLLFGKQINPYDEDFSAYMYENLQSIYASESIFSEMADLALRFALQTEEHAYQFTADTEEDAFTFASMMARLAYTFTSETETDAYNFATHMADLAYSFTMDIEEDAYQFAMQGMEYGYLFASRGEEVGVMADRILWMAVQIGQMADRIGEMADRIVYTEQLIVYTEMLILDFGLLIYGGMTQITNMVLTGMALILDREWYAPETEDQIVTLLGETTKQMMAQMQEYSLAVLDNQATLREITLEALSWISKEY
jgi:hypothetical protein